MNIFLECQIFSNDGRINDLEANNGINESDVDEVLETLFDQPDDQKDKHSEDPFGLYPLLNKENIELARKVTEEDHSLSHPPGFTPEEGLNEGNTVNLDMKDYGENEKDDNSFVNLEDGKDNSESVNKNSESKRSGFYAFALLRSLNPKENLGLIDEFYVFERSRPRPKGQKRLGKGVVLFKINDSVGNSGGILCIWDPNSFRRSSFTRSDYFVIVRGVWLKSGIDLMIVVVYAPQEAKEKRMLWDYLAHVSNQWVDSISLIWVRKLGEICQGSKLGKEVLWYMVFISFFLDGNENSLQSETELTILNGSLMQDRRVTKILGKVEQVIKLFMGRTKILNNCVSGGVQNLSGIDSSRSRGCYKVGVINVVITLIEAGANGENTRIWVDNCHQSSDDDNGHDDEDDEISSDKRYFDGKEQAYTDMYGKWDDSFIQMGDFKEELQSRNAGSVVDIDFETVGRFNGVLAAAIGIDGNNGLFPIAYGVLESENGNSWTWFLESLKKAIGTPDGLVISSDMQKGLDLAIMQVYPNVEHIECMRHLYSNFKKKYRGDFFKSKLWGAANTYCVIQHERLLKKLSCVSEDAISFLSLNHNKIWSRSKFGTASKCDYITNNVSEAFNAWIGPFHFQPVLDLLDNIREELSKCFDEKMMVVEKWNGTLVPMAKKYLTISSRWYILVVWDTSGGTTKVGHQKVVFHLYANRLLGFERPLRMGPLQANPWINRPKTKAVPHTGAPVGSTNTFASVLKEGLTSESVLVLDDSCIEVIDSVSWSLWMSIIINDRRKVILQGNAFWIRVKELDAWVPDFDKESEDETTSYDRGRTYAINTGGSILELMDELVACGQAMGYSLGNKAKRRWINELCHKHRINFVSLQETKAEDIDLFSIKEVWGNYSFQHVVGSLVGFSGGITCIWDPNRFILDHVSKSDYFVALMGFDTFVENCLEIPRVEEGNGLIRLKKKLQLLKLAIKEWTKSERMKSHDKKSKILKNLVDLDKFRWSIEGDENSKYFHGVINKRRSQLANIYPPGILVDGDWISDPAVVKREFFKHFQNQFSPSQSSRVQFDFAFPTRLTSEQVADLDNEVSYNEVKAAVWDCGINKSPGPDGFTFEFFRRYWAFIDQDVFDAVKTFFLDGLFPRGCNSSFIASFQRFSMPNRQILDGPFIINDIISWCKQNRFKGMLFKVDFAKAFDSVKWEFLEETLKSFGFSPIWCKWIKGCLNNARGSVLVNGSPTSEFQFFKGLKQGDPLSPFLFILVMETLHLSFMRICNAGLYTKCFYLASGLKININKSKIMGMGVPSGNVDLAANLVGCSILHTPFNLSERGV
ncbi:RNA-directed DNA polymerase, eukaryota [Tanacetum coccineum]